MERRSKSKAGFSGMDCEILPKKRVLSLIGARYLNISAKKPKSDSL